MIYLYSLKLIIILKYTSDIVIYQNMHIITKEDDLYETYTRMAQKS